MPSGDFLPFDPIAEAHRQQIALARVEAVLRPYGVTFARYEVLMLLYLSRTGSLTMTKLGELLQVHPTSVTNAVDRLEAAGFVKRGPHPTDRRTALVQILEKGRELAAEATLDLNAQVFTKPGLSVDSINSLVTILAELRRVAGDF